MTRQTITKAELRLEVQHFIEDTAAISADVTDLLNERQLRPGPLASLSFARRALERAKEGLNNALILIDNTEEN